MYRNADRGGQAAAIGNIHRTIGEVWLWFSSYASEQTDILITILRTPPGAE